MKITAKELLAEFLLVVEAFRLEPLFPRFQQAQAFQLSAGAPLGQPSRLTLFGANNGTRLKQLMSAIRLSPPLADQFMVRQERYPACRKQCAIILTCALKT